MNTKFSLSLLALLFFCFSYVKAEDISSTANNNYSALTKFIGKKINKVFIVSDVPLNGELEKHVQLLQGKRFDVNEIQATASWLFEALKDTKIDILVKGADGFVDIDIKIKLYKKITKIELKGIKHADYAELMSASGLHENDDFLVDNIANAKSKVEDYLKNNGFLNATVELISDDNGLVQFKINEGDLTVVEEIIISKINAVTDDKFRKILEQNALSSFGIKKGERFSRKKINEGILRLKEWLKNRDFLLAKEPTVNSVILENGKIARLEIMINFGPRIHFGFRNNERFSNKELTAFLSDIQDVSIGNDYLESVKSKIKEAYDDVGLVNAKVETQINDDPKKGYKFVSIIVEENKRIRIDKIQIEGIYSFQQEELLDLFLSYSPRLVRRYYFQPQGINTAANQLAESLRAKGYLSARFDLAKFHFDEKRTKVEVDLYFSEGVQTTVSSIEISGSNNITSQEIKNILQVEAGKPFDVFSFEKGISQLKEKYRNLGYLDAEVVNSNDVVSYSSDQSQVNIKLQIKEGELMRVGEFFVRGNKQTHARVITRELPFETGDVLTEQLLVEAEENLRKLNLFSSVIVRNIARPGSSSVRDVVVLVQESIPGVIETGPGFRNDLGLRYYIGASYQNLGGWHRGVNSRIIINRRLENFKFFEYNINLGFREPYFAGMRVTLLNNIYFVRRIFSSFDATINKATSELRKNLTKKVTGLLQYSFEYVKVFNAKEFRDNKVTRIGAITPGIIFDSRNDIFNPSEGLFSVNRLEIASSAFASEKDVGYYRATSNNSTYFGLAKDLVWSLALNYGFERSNVQDKEIPKIKLFRLGGTSTIRGYQEEALEVDGQNVIKGTLSMLNYRSELRFPLEGDFGGAIFWDAGNLYIDKIQPLRVRHSTGIGLRYKTPVGPISLDFARKLGTVGPRGDRVNTEDRDTQRVHFSIGSF